MQLKKIRIQNFQSVIDSNEFEVGDVTCLVGKNEAGKTAMLKALYRLNPLNPQDSNYDATHNYPRKDFAVYESEAAKDPNKAANVVTGTFLLDEKDIEEISSLLGKDSLPDRELTLTLSRGYSNALRVGQLDLLEEPAIRHLISSYDLPESTAARLRQLSTAHAMLDSMQKDDNDIPQAEKLVEALEAIQERGLSFFVYQTLLKERVPKFLYFDEYYQMKGQDNLDSLLERTQSGTLEDSDHPLLGLIGLAGLRLDTIVSADNTETLIARLEAAGNRLTQSVLRYWSQNSHLRMRFDIREARPQDGPGMNRGTNIWGRVEDTRHMVSTALGTRSKGFVWFFSFLAWYDKLRRDGENLILLLDEPGLSLHGRAQADLLSYFEQELRPHHQLIYTTHSPFMVDPGHFDRVRIVQDLSIEPHSDDLPEERQGTKVSTDVLEATSDSLFPLQGALGYESSSFKYSRGKLWVLPAQGPQEQPHRLTEQAQPGECGDVAHDVGGVQPLLSGAYAQRLDDPVRGLLESQPATVVLHQANSEVVEGLLGRWVSSMSSRRAWCQSRLNSSCSRASSSVRLNISLRRWTPRTVCTAGWDGRCPRSTWEQSAPRQSGGAPRFGKPRPNFSPGA